MMVLHSGPIIESSLEQLRHHNSWICRSQLRACCY